MPHRKLAFVGRELEKAGSHDMAFAIHRAYRAAKLMVEGATPAEVELDSWTDFESWFDKAKSQGLEFVFSDRYGEDSEVTQKVKHLVEAYNLLERETHELYLMLKAAEEPAAGVGVVEEEVVVAPDEVVEEEVVEEAPAEDADADAAADAALDDAADSLEEGMEEEEVLAPEASTEPGALQTKTVKRLEKMLRRANIGYTTVVCRDGNNHKYRILCASEDHANKALTLFGNLNWNPTRQDHVTGRIFVDVNPIV